MAEENEETFFEQKRAVDHIIAEANRTNTTDAVFAEMKRLMQNEAYRVEHSLKPKVEITATVEDFNKEWVCKHGDSSGTCEFCLFNEEPMPAPPGGWSFLKEIEDEPDRQLAGKQEDAEDGRRSA